MLNLRGRAVGVVRSATLCVAGRFLRTGCLGLALAAGVSTSRLASAQPCEAGWVPIHTSDVLSRDGFTKALCFASHPSGDIIIAGEFIPSGSWPHRGIVRYNPVTNSFIQMGAGMGPGVMHIATLPDGDVIGFWGSAGGVSVSGIPRYDFETQTWSSIGNARPSSIATMAVAPDGGIIMGGSFTSIGTLPVNRIARLDSNTGVWTQLGEGLNGAVFSVAVFPDNVIVACGNFTAAGTQPVPGVAMFDPALGTWAPVPGTTQSFTQVVIGANGVLHALGISTNRRTAFRYDRNAQQWNVLGLGTTGIFWPSSLAIRPDGKVVGKYDRGVLVLDPASDAWVDLGTFGFTGIFAIGVAPNNDVFIGGHLTVTGDGVPWNRRIPGVIRYQDRFQEWTHVGRGVDDWVTEFAPADDGTVWIGGQFRSTNGEASGALTRFDPAQSDYLPVFPGPFAVVQALHRNQTFGLMVGSMYETRFPGFRNRRVWALDEATPSWRRVGIIDLPSQYPWDGARDLITLNNGDVLALGPQLSRLNSISGNWSQLTTGTFNTSLALPDGDVIIAGRRVQRFDPETNQLSDLAPGSNLTVNAMALLPDDDLLVGGSFSQIGGVAVRNLARYDFHTATWSDFAGGVSSIGSVSVDAIHVTPDGQVLIAGSITSVGPPSDPLAVANIAQFNPANNTWQAFGRGLENIGPTFGNTGLTLQPMPDGGFLVGGYFTRAGGMTSPYLARWATTNPPVILQQPQPALLCANGNITMSFGVGSTRNAIFRWQWQPPASSNWVDLVEGDNLVGDIPVLRAAGINRRSITFSALEGLPENAPVQLRCIATTPCGEVMSNSTSLTLRPPCDCYDFNRDLTVDALDAQDMAAVVSGQRLRDPSWLSGDLNNDENTDLTDAQILAAYIATGICGV